MDPLSIAQFEIDAVAFLEHQGIATTHAPQVDIQKLRKIDLIDVSKFKRSRPSFEVKTSLDLAKRAYQLPKAQPKQPEP